MCWGRSNAVGTKGGPRLRVRRIILSGLLGGVVLSAWGILGRGFLPFYHDAAWREIPNESLVFEAVTEQIRETGSYIYPYDVPADSAFHARFEEGPAFQILFRGESLEETELRDLALFALGLLFVPIIPAWVLSVTSHRRAAHYGQRVLFVALFGLLVALFHDLPAPGVHAPLDLRVALALDSIVGWTLVGMVLAWRIKPTPG
jgi:hypothetical protein